MLRSVLATGHSGRSQTAGTIMCAHVGHMYTLHQTHSYLCTQSVATHETHMHTRACVHPPHGCTWVHTHTHTHVHTCAQSHTACECAHLWAPTHINTQRHTRAHPFRHTAHEDKYMHTCIPHVHTGHTHAHLCTHIHTRAHSDMVWGSPQDYPGFSDLLGSQHVAVLLATIYQ